MAVNSRSFMKMIKFFRQHKFFFFIIAALALGLMGGVAGSWLAKSYLFDSSYNLAAGDYSAQGLVISNAKNVIVQQDAKIDETVNSAGASLVGIYKKQKLAKPAGGGFAAENFYKISEAAAQGFIITADGWIVTAFPLAKNYNDYVVIGGDKKIYPIERAASDSLTEFNFIQVAAEGFPVRKLAENWEIKRGSLAIGVNQAGLSWISYVKGFSQKKALLKSSDGYAEKLVLNDKVPAEFTGSVIFNLAGDALGLVGGSGEIEPIAHLKSAARSLFLNKTAARPYLGVNYINLAELAPVVETVDFPQKGAVIYRDAKGVAVQKNSPAEKAGLREGDIIVSVGKVDISKENNLANIIQDYLAGDKIILSYWRGTEKKEAEAVLGELK